MKNLYLNIFYYSVIYLLILLLSSTNLNAQALSVVVTPASSNSSTNGAIDLTVSFGFPPYTFEWSNGAATEDINELSIGEYTVHVYDKYCGVVNKTVIIYSCSSISFPMTLTEEHINVPSSTANSGSIDLTVADLISPGNYEYVWENENNELISDEEDVSGLSVGIYCVTVTNACQASVSTCVEIISCEIFLSRQVIQPSCSQSNDGEIDLTVTGNGPFSFIWSNGETSEDLIGIPNGLYTVTITNSSNCSIQTAIILFGGLDSDFEIWSITGPDCFSGNGYIDISINNGSSDPYSYEWSNGATSEDIYDLTAGLYTVTVTDANGCTKSKAIVIQNSVEIIDGQVTNTCQNGSTGTIDVTAFAPNNQTQFLLYEWDNGEIGHLIHWLEAGTYCVTVSNLLVGECFDVECYEVLEDPNLSITITGEIQDPCSGQDNGSIDILIESTVSLQWEALWDNGATTIDLDNVATGTYCVTLTDGLACSVTDCYSVGAYPPQELSFEEECGIIDLTVIGGEAPYSYEWSTEENTQDITTYSAGEACVTVIDSKGCEIIGCLIIPGGDIEISGVVEDACRGTSIPPDVGGGVDITISGGVEPFSFLWSNGEMSQNIMYKPQGDYSITITDANGCTETASFYIDNEFNIQNISYGWLECKADFYCGDENLGGEKSFYEKVWAASYDNPFFTQFNYENPCDKYKICPLDNTVQDIVNIDPGSGYHEFLGGYGDGELCWYSVRCREYPWHQWYYPYESDGLGALLPCCGDCEGFSGNGELIPKSIETLVNSDGEIEYIVTGNNSTLDTSYVKNYNSTLFNTDFNTYAGENILLVKEGKDTSIVFAGSFTSELVGANEMFNQNLGQKDIFMARYNKDGIEDWFVNIASQGNEVLNGFSTDNLNNIIATGSFNENIMIVADSLELEDKDAFLYKYDKFGALIWVKNFGGTSDDQGVSLGTDSNNNIIATGVFSGEFSYDGSIIAGLNDLTKDLYLIQSNPNGELNWSRRIKSQGNNIENIELIVVENDDIIIKGCFNNNLLFVESGVNYSSSNSNKQFFLARFDSQGNLLWSRTEGLGTGDTFANGLIVDENGNIFIGGNFSGKITFDESYQIISAGLSDVFIAKFHGVSGAFLEVNNQGTDSDEYCGDLVSNNNGKIAYVGHFYGDSTVIEGAFLVGNGTTLPKDYIVEMANASNAGLYTNETTIEDSLAIDGMQVLKIFPNPFSNEFRIHLKVTTPIDVYIKIYDTLGKLITEKLISIAKGENTIYQKLEDHVPNGLYQVEISSKKGYNSTHKIILNR